MPIRAADLEYERDVYIEEVYGEKYCRAHIDFPIGSSYLLYVNALQIYDELLYRKPNAEFPRLIIRLYDNTFIYMIEVLDIKYGIVSLEMYTVMYGKPLAGVSHISESTRAKWPISTFMTWYGDIIAGVPTQI